MKNVIITGSSSGIGLELVKIFNDKGFKVISLSRSNLPVKSLKQVKHINFDITKEESIEKLIGIVNEEFGKIDILINNAGKLINRPFNKLSKQDFYSVFDVNVFSVVSLIQKLLPCCQH